MISRDDALALVNEHVKNQNLVKHCLATEAIMKTLAQRFGEDVDCWGIAGLLHDLDFEATKETPERHGLVTAELLADVDVPPELIEAVKEHNAEALGVPRQTRFGKALTCAESITGLVVATALVYPDKRLASVKLKSVKKRMKMKAFARNVDRDLIRVCEEIELPLDEFIEISLTAMTSAAEDLGL